MGESINYPAIPHMASIKKASDLYGLSPHYIRRLCKEGKVRYVNAGHRWLVNLDSLAQYFTQGDPAPAEQNSQQVHGIRRVAASTRIGEV